MARIINIDKFKDTADVEVDGKHYNVSVLTVDEYINDTVTPRLDGARKQGVPAYCKEAIAVLGSRSNIPEAVLKKLTPRQLEAVLLAMQGIDPELLEKLSGDGDGGK